MRHAKSQRQHVGNIERPEIRTHGILHACLWWTLRRKCWQYLDPRIIFTENAMKVKCGVVSRYRYCTHDTIYWSTKRRKCASVKYVQENWWKSNFRCKQRKRFLYIRVRASWIEFNNCPTRCDLFSLLHFCRQLYMFRVLTPIIRSSHNCNYSFWYWLTAMNKIRC